MKHVLFVSLLMVLLAFSSAFSQSMPPGDHDYIIDQTGETIQMDISTDITAPVDVELATDDAVSLMSEGVFSVYDYTSLRKDSFLKQSRISHTNTSAQFSYISRKLLNSSVDFMQNSCIYVHYGLRFRYG